jgi:hypothetical protein
MESQFTQTDVVVVGGGLAGDWIGEGFLSDPSMGSARQAAQRILKGELTRSPEQKLEVLEV